MSWILKSSGHVSLVWWSLGKEQVSCVSSHQGRFWGAQQPRSLGCILLRWEDINKSIHTALRKCGNTKNTCSYCRNNAVDIKLHSYMEMHSLRKWSQKLKDTKHSKAGSSLATMILCVNTDGSWPMVSPLTNFKLSNGAQKWYKFNRNQALDFELASLPRIITHG